MNLATRITRYTVFISFLICAVIVLLTMYVIKKYPENVIEFVQGFIPVVTPAPLQIKGIAVIGDSQSDEYRGDDKRGMNYESTTLNWVEILSAKRKINFGEWGTYEEPRRTGFMYNFAR